jgi:hypothetical protein
MIFAVPRRRGSTTARRERAIAAFNELTRPRFAAIDFAL